MLVGWSVVHRRVEAIAIEVLALAMIMLVGSCAQNVMSSMVGNMAGRKVYIMREKVLMMPAVWRVVQIVSCVVWDGDRRGRRGKERVTKVVRRGRCLCILVMLG